MSVCDASSRMTRCGSDVDRQCRSDSGDGGEESYGPPHLDIEYHLTGVQALALESGRKTSADYRTSVYGRDMGIFEADPRSNG